MKKLFVLLVFAAFTGFAQHGGHGGGGGHIGGYGGGHVSASPHASAPSARYSAPVARSVAPAQRYSQRSASQGWSHFGRPGYGSLAFRPVIVRPGFGGYYGGGYGYGGWGYWFGLGFWPWYNPYPYVYENGVVIPAYQSQPCKKESLKDSTGAKHDILLCVQSDGSMKVVADADEMTAVPKDEVKQ